MGESLSAARKFRFRGIRQQQGKQILMGMHIGLAGLFTEFGHAQIAEAVFLPRRSRGFRVQAFLQLKGRGIRVPGGQKIHIRPGGIRVIQSAVGRDAQIAQALIIRSGGDFPVKHSDDSAGSLIVAKGFPQEVTQLGGVHGQPCAGPQKRNEERQGGKGGFHSSASTAKVSVGGNAGLATYLPSLNVYSTLPHIFSVSDSGGSGRTNSAPPRNMLMEVCQSVGMILPCASLKRWVMSFSPDTLESSAVIYAVISGLISLPATARGMMARPWTNSLLSRSLIVPRKV